MKKKRRKLVNMWINNRLPEIKKGILLLIKLPYMENYDECYESESKLFIQTEGYFAGDGWYEWSGDKLNDIIAWTDLPKLPKIDEEKKLENLASLADPIKNKKEQDIRSLLLKLEYECWVEEE